MANAVYDPETENQNAPAGNLGQAEQNGGLYNSGNGDSTSAKAVSPDDLKNSEETGNGNSLYNPNDRGSRLQRARSRVRSISRNKWLVGAAAGAGGIVVLIMLLLILLSSMKLPNVMQNIEAYAFARVTRQFSQSAQRTTEETLAVDAASEGTAAEGATASNPGGVYGSLKDKYQSLRDNTWGKLDNYRPNKVIDNLGKNNRLELRYKTSNLTGREIFTGGTVDGVAFDIKPVTGIAKWTPGLNQIVKFKNQQAFYKSGFFEAANETMKTTDVAPLVRGSVFKILLNDTGGSLRGWLLSKFTSTDPTKNEIAATEEMYQATEAGANAADNAKTAQIAEADAAVKSATDEAAKSPDQVKQALANGGDVQAAQDAVDKAVNPSLTSEVLGNANFTYAVATPLCIIYDGSVQQSGPSINNQTNQQQNAFAALASRADEQKAGGPPNNNLAGELDSAIQGTNSQLGDTTKSNPEIRASGGTVNTSDIPSAEAGSSGSYDFSIFNALGVSPTSAIGTAANYVVGETCSTLTNTYVAGGIAIANIIAAIISLGSTQAAEEAAGQTASQLVTQYMKTVASNAIAKLTAKEVITKGAKTIERGTLNRALRFTFKQGLIVGGTVGATELAHLIVASRAGITNNGFAQGADLVNEADSGAGIQAGELSRQQSFGRPLTNGEVAQSDKSDVKALADRNRSQSFSQRYFATNNADSLVSHMGLALDSSLHGGIMASIIRLGLAIFKPVGSLVTIMGSINSSVRAAPDPSTQHYGNVQFGWSDAEENLIDSSNSYKLLENQKILDNSGMEPAIAQKYAKCFGYSADSTGALTSNLGSDGSLSSLLSNGDIMRDSVGNVVDDSSALCSPANLGPGNSEFGPQMVFRWRLANGYSQTLDQLTQMQTVSSDSGSPTATPASGFTNPFPDGWTPGRLDMGYDGAFKNKIVSPCDGKMVYVNANTSHGDLGGWKGAFIAVKCSQPIPGFPSDVFFFAEGLSPTVTQDQTVTAGQQIAVPGWTGYSEGPGGIEWGLGNPDNPATVTLAASGINGMTNCSAASKTMVLAFSQWVQKNLGVAPPASTGDAGCA